MSGSSGGGYGGGVSTTAWTCEDLVIVTQISSTKVQAIGGIVVGTILDVAVQQVNSVAVVVVLHQGQIVGGVASIDVNRLRDCILGGTVYSAEVIAVNGPQISIRIRAI